MSTIVNKLVESVEILTQEIQELYLESVPFVVGYSGGKDSTVTLQLIWNAITQLPVEERIHPINVITTDTQVENPIVAAWVKRSIQNMQLAAKEQQMPVYANLLTPKVGDTFWVNLIGKGYAAPRNNFRWCTERLKIKPSNQFVVDKIKASGEIILALGTRKKESTTRAISMLRREKGRVRDRLSPNPSLPGSLTYSPIEDWTTEDVWIYLNQWQNPWGHSNKELFVMYRGATADNECPLVVDTSTPSCGDSRFGCWVCTMVSKDKSMEAMIDNDAQKEWMQPLLDIRNELDVEDDRDRRDFRRMNGNVQLYVLKNGQTSNIPGPYLKEWREYWLRRVLEAQTQVRRYAPSELRDLTLISSEELAEIRRIWVEDKHEFEDTLPRIYEEVTGQPYGGLLLLEDKLTPEDWNELKALSATPLELELISSLLGTRQNQSSPEDLYKLLEKCFKRSSRSKEEALMLPKVEVAASKPTSWASLKFQIEISKPRPKFSQTARQLASQLLEDLEILKESWQAELKLALPSLEEIQPLEQRIVQLEEEIKVLQNKEKAIVLSLENLRDFEQFGDTTQSDKLTRCEAAQRETVKAIAKTEKEKQGNHRKIEAQRQRYAKAEADRDDKAHYLKVLPRVISILQLIR